MYRHLKFTGLTAVAIVGCMALSSAAPRAFAQAVQAQPAKQKAVKDAAEHDLFTKVTKETDPEKKLALLEQWREKYPDTDFQDERLGLYSTVNHPEKVLEVGLAMLAKDPANSTALYLVTLNTTKLTNPTADQLAGGEKAAKGLLANLDKVFAPEKKPANLGEPEWKKARTDVEAIANATLQWIAMVPGTQAMQKKDYATAERELTKALQQFPNSGQASYWLSYAIAYQKNVDKYPQAIYHMARAAALDTASGGLPEAGRKEADAALVKLYTGFHGADAEGLKQLKETAAAQPFPPADFKIKSTAEIAAENEEKFRQSNPQLALWLGIKKELAGANGEQYFATNVKDAAVPKLKGTVVAGKPAVSSKELLVGIENAQVAEVSLKLDTPLRGRPKAGSVVEWEGVPTAFSKDPFLVTFDVEKAKITGLEVEAAPAAKKAAPKKSRAASK